MSYLTHKDMLVWQRAQELVEAVYLIAGNLPASENFVLIPQLQRSAISVSSNIAEGRGRQGLNDYIRFLNIAKASPMN